MRRFVIVLLVSTGLLAGCGAPVDPALTGTEWRLLSVTTGEETVEPTGSEPNVASITFGEDGEGGPRFSGGGGCNRIFGSYEADAGRLEIGPVGSTRMACPEPEMRLERALTSALSTAGSYSLEDRELTIRFEGGSMRLRPMD